MSHNFDDLMERMSPAAKAEIERRVNASLAEMPLEELRNAREMTQAQLADILQVSQGAISKVERRTDMYVSTLRSYIRSMGGDLQIRATFPDGDVIIDQFRDIPRRVPSEAEEDAAA